ncbi:MAG: PCP reductase family protein, partial [Desulfomonilaceae bacterium]
MVSGEHFLISGYIILSINIGTFVIETKPISFGEYDRLTRRLGMRWSQKAEEAIAKVPFFIRRRVRKKV